MPQPSSTLPRPPGESDHSEKRHVVQERQYNSRDFELIARRLRADHFTGKVTVNFSQGDISAITSEQKQSI